MMRLSRCREHFTLLAVILLALPSAILGFVLPSAMVGRLSLYHRSTFPVPQEAFPSPEIPSFSSLCPRVSLELHARRRSNRNQKSNRGAYHNQARFHRKWGAEGPSIRQERVASLVQTELTNIIYSEKVRGKPLEPELRRRITIVSVDMSPDLLHARVSVSIRKAFMPGEDEDVDVDEDNRRIDNDYRIRAMQEPVDDYDVDMSAFGDDIKPKKKRNKGGLFGAVETSSEEEQSDGEEEDDNVAGDDFLEHIQEDEEHQGFFENVLGREREEDDDELEEEEEESIIVPPEEAEKLGIHNSSDVPFTPEDVAEFWKEFGPSVDAMQTSNRQKKQATIEADGEQDEEVLEDDENAGYEDEEENDDDMEFDEEDEGDSAIDEGDGDVNAEYLEDDEEEEDEELQAMKDFDWSDEAIAGLLEEDDMDYSSTDGSEDDDDDDDDAHNLHSTDDSEENVEEDWETYREKYGIPEGERHLFSEDHIIQSQPSVNQRRAFVWLVRNAQSIRYALGKKMHHMRRIPELTFVRVDLGEAVDMSMLIDRISELEDDYEDDELPRGEQDGIDYDMDEDDEWEEDDEDNDAI